MCAVPRPLLTRRGFLAAFDLCSFELLVRQHDDRSDFGCCSPLGGYANSMTTPQQNPKKRPAPERSQAGHESDEWIDETMAEGDIANGEGNPNDLPNRKPKR
jgi:hypothetical protein